MPKRFDPQTGRRDYYRKASSGGTPGAHTHPPSDVIPQGSGSLLDADLLDGHSSAYFQVQDADLDALAALGTTGLLARVAASTWALRSIAAGSSKIGISYGDGVSGNPTIDAIEANFNIASLGGTLSHNALSGVTADQHHAQAHSAADHSGNIFPGANQNLGAFYQDVAQITAPTNPGTGVRRLFCDSASGELSVKTAAGSTVSLESGGSGAHNLLSATHSDTVVQTPSVGSLIVGNATPAWDELVANATATNKFLRSVSSGVPSWEQVAYADLSGTLPIGNGGTGQTTAQLAINALTAVAAATNEHVLTKDTATGNAIFKVSAGGGVTDHGALTGLADDDHTQYALLAGRGTGQTLIGGVNTTNSLTLKPNSVDGTGYLNLDGEVDLRNSLTALAALTAYNCIGFNSALTIAGAGTTLKAFDFSPTAAIMGSGFAYTPVKLGGTFTFGTGSGSNTNYQIDCTATCTTGAASIASITPPAAFVDRQTLKSEHTNAKYVGTFASLYSFPTFNAVAGGTGFPTNFSHCAVYDYPTYIAGASLTNFFNRVGLDFLDPAYTGAGTNYQYGSVALRVADQTLTNFINRVCAVDSAMNANSVLHYNLFCGGTAPSAHLGPVVVGAAAQPTNASTGLEVQSTTKALLPSRLTTTQKNALTAVDGMVVYDSTLARMQGRINGAWGSMGPTPTSYHRRRANSGAQYGSTNTKVVLWANAVESAGSDITFVASATNGDSFQVVKSGVYAVSVSMSGAAAGNSMEIQVGPSILNTNDNTQVRARQLIPNGWEMHLTWTGYVAANEYIYLSITASAALGASYTYDKQITVAHLW